MALKALPLVCTHYNTACGAKGGSRVTVVYADSVFLLNGAMDYVLLLVTAALLEFPFTGADICWRLWRAELTPWRSFCREWAF